jgi:hypothetical protein
MEASQRTLDEVSMVDHPHDPPPLTPYGEPRR